MSDPPELSEDVDIDPQKRRFVLDAHARMTELTHYELLGVPRTADKKAVKRAYFALAAILHPDRYYGKKLGSYRPKMEALFSRLTTAFETLTDQEKRAQYDARLGAPSSARSSPSPGSSLRAPENPKVVAQRQAAMDALRQRFTEAKAKARHLAERAALARAAGDFAAATEAYRQAIALSPSDASLKAGLDEMERAMAAKLADSQARQAMLEEKYGHWGEAAASWRKVLEGRPDDAVARARLAAAEARVGSVKRER